MTKKTHNHLFHLLLLTLIIFGFSFAELAKSAISPSLALADVNGLVPSTSASQLWRSEVNGSQIQSLIVSGGYVYATSHRTLSSENVLSCFDASTGREVWSWGFYWLGQAVPVLRNGLLYIIGAIDPPHTWILYALDASTGRQIWASSPLSLSSNFSVAV